MRLFNNMDFIELGCKDSKIVANFADGSNKSHPSGSTGLLNRNAARLQALDRASVLSVFHCDCKIVQTPRYSGRLCFIRVGIKKGPHKMQSVFHLLYPNLSIKKLNTLANYF
jgi:hypothetical protein